MSLQYRMIAEDRRSDSRAACERALALWLRDRKQLEPDLDRNGRYPLRDRVELSVTRASSASVDVQRFALYEEQQGGRWTTALTLLQHDENRWVWLDLEWVSENPWSVAPVVKPPRLAEYLLIDESVHIGPVTLPPAYFLCSTAEEATALARLITDEVRGWPIVVLSPDIQSSSSQIRARAVQLSRELVGVAPVYLLATENVDAFNDELPVGLAVYGGAARTYLPGIGSPASAMARHRVLGGTAFRSDSFHAAEMVGRQLRARSLATRPPDIYRSVGRKALRSEDGPDELDSILADTLAAEEAADRARDEVDRLNGSLETAVLETLEAQSELDNVLSRVRFLESELAAREIYLAGEATPDSFEPVTVNSFDDVLSQTRTRLKHVIVGPTDASAATLDSYVEAPAWARKTWRALAALESYALASTKGWQGDFKQWCLDPASSLSTVIPANWVALGESGSVDNNPKYHDARVFSVPKSAVHDGVAYMCAHVKIVEGGRPAPRLHFHDATSSDGKIYVGYIGPHLPNDQTN